MGNSEEEEQGVSIRIPRKAAAALLTVVLTFLFGGTGLGLVNLVTDARHDPFTGSQGVILENRIEELEKRLRALELKVFWFQKDFEAFQREQEKEHNE